MVRAMRVILGLILACGALGAATATAGNTVARTAAGGSVSCSTSATIGYMGPTTGQVASIGEELRDWPLFYISQWNATHKLQIHLVEGDDQFDPSQASTIAQQFGSNAAMLGVLGPGSSPEVEAAAPLFKKAGISYIAATATNATLTNGTYGHFFRIAPPDSVQAQTTATYMEKVLKVKSVAIFDDQSAYSKPLADTVEGLLKKAGVSVFRSSVSPTATDYSSTITTIPSGTQIVYTPFTNPANMQLFGQQMVDQGKNIPMFAGDSGYSSKFHIVGARFSTFAPDIRDLPADKATIAAYFKKEGSNAPLTTYGPPSYVAAQMMLAAVAKACADGTATRAEVNADLHQVSLKTSLLGHPIKFTSKGEDAGAQFVIFEINKAGKPVVIQK